MPHERKRGESRMDLSDVVEALGVLSGLISSANERLERIEGKLDAARRTATRRAHNQGIIDMKTKDMIQAFVAVQTGLTNDVEANSSLITKLIAEIRKAGDASEMEMPPEVETVLAGFEANRAALAAATAAGTAAVPADIPIPPVVDVPGDTA